MTTTSVPRSEGPGRELKRCWLVSAAHYESLAGLAGLSEGQGLSVLGLPVFVDADLPDYDRNLHHGVSGPSVPDPRPVDC